jgi:hypothetical protein
METTFLFKPMHARFRLLQPPLQPILLDSANGEFDDTLSVIETYIDPEPGESFRSMVYRMAGRCEERINNLEQAACALVEAWNLFQRGVPACSSMEPAVKVFEQFIGEQWP